MTAWKRPARAGACSWLAWAGYAVALALAPWVWDGSLGLTLLSQIGVAIIGCLAFNLLLGQGGMLSFGHAVYAGLGAFCAIHTLRLVNAGAWWVPVSLVPLMGGLAGLGLAALLGYATTRKAGTPFAMITLGVGELVWAVALMFPAVFGGEGGISANRVVREPVLGITFGPPLELYYLIALYTLLCTALLFAFTRTPLGRMLNAVRENPDRAACLGYDPRLVRYLAFVVSGFFMGVSGGLAALNFEIVTTEVLGASRSGAYLLFTFVGGTMVFYGPIIGAVLMVLALVLFSTFTQAWLLYLGLLFMAMVMFAPGGVAGLLQGWGAGLGACLRAGPDAAAARRRLAARLALGAPLLAAALGSTALVEMTYHRQLNAALGPQMQWLGLTLDTTRAWHWLSMLLSVASALALAWAIRRWQRRTGRTPGMTA